MTTHLLYIADPMCSWCYGFGPELRAFLKTLPEARLDIVLGGLRAYNTQAMDQDVCTMILGHWQKVAQVSGLPFAQESLLKPGFVYDTEPACRAVVAARTLAEDMPPTLILDVFTAIQDAFYAKSIDVTQVNELAKVAVGAMNDFDGTESFDVESFLETLTSPMTINETRQDFEQIQRWGVRGYPVLLLAKPEGLHMLSSGYTKVDQLIAAHEAVA
jgi:putative protein-disulfide isomerase